MKNSNIVCPHCSNSDDTMLELETSTITKQYWFCGICSKNFIIEVKNESGPDNQADKTG
jgi:transposase-like protein